VSTALVEMTLWHTALSGTPTVSAVVHPSGPDAPLDLLAVVAEERLIEGLAAVVTDDQSCCA
jgi:hypothetical protein